MMINNISRRYLKLIFGGIFLGLLASAVVSYLHYAERETAQVIDSQEGILEELASTTTPVDTESNLVATTTEPTSEVSTSTEEIVVATSTPETSTTTEAVVGTSTPSTPVDEEATSTPDVVQETVETISSGGGGGSTSSELEEVVEAVATSTEEEFVATSTPETSSSTESIASSTEDVVEVQATAETEVSVDTEPVAIVEAEWLPLTPRDCHTPEGRGSFPNPGECMRSVRR